jgi:two-component sensor histidine kinase
MIGSDRSIKVVVEAGAGTASSSEAVSIGLIATELLINAVKHAFPDNRSGTTRVKYESSGDDWHLSVSDDGIGPVRQDGQAAPAGLGTSIVEALAHQLGARLQHSGGSNGMTVSIILAAARPGDPKRPAIEMPVRNLSRS